MNQAFYTLLYLYECTIIREVDNMPRNLSSHGEFCICVNPGIGFELFEPQRDPLLFSIKTNDLDSYIITPLVHRGGMRNPAPGHVSYMKQSIYTTKVYKQTVVGDILYLTI